MKQYTWNDETYNKIPDPLHLADGSSISPVSEEKFIELGGTVSDDGEPTHLESLDSACDVFIAVVLEIAEKIGDPTFMGGYNEQDKLLNSEYAQEHTTEALVLSNRWNGANLTCNYYANKPDVNMPSPVWFWYAWQRYAEQLEAKKGK